MYKNINYVKEYDDFISDYEDSQKHLKLFVELDEFSNFNYESKNIELSDAKLKEKFVPKIEIKEIKRKNKKSNKKVF